MRALSSPRTLLQQLIRQRRTSYERLVDELDDFARTRKIDATISVRHLQRLARNEQQRAAEDASALTGTQRLLEEFFGHPFPELVGPPAEEPSEATSTLVVASDIDPRQLTAGAARESLEFLSWATDDRIPEALLEYVFAELRRIAVDYVHSPAMPLFADLSELRDTTFGLLRERPHPRQARQLFFVAGTVCTLMAHASQNMGNSAARAQAATAWACADQADHRDLRAWVRGTQALIAEWTLHYREALDFIREGRRYAASPDQHARLASIEARTFARTGDARAALKAIERAARARERPDQPDELGAIGGILSFPQVKQMYYTGSTLVLAGRATDGEQMCGDAIRAYETGPSDQRSYGDEAIARVDVALARLQGDDIDGAAEALKPVLLLPHEQRIRQLTDSLIHVRERLILPRYVHTPAARSIIDELNEFADLAEPIRRKVLQPT